MDWVFSSGVSLLEGDRGGDGHSLEGRAMCQWFEWTVVYCMYKLLFLVLQQYLNQWAPLSCGHLEGFLEHMVKMAKRLDSTPLSKYIHDRSLSLLHSKELGSGLQAGDGWEPGAAIVQVPDQT